MKLTFAVIFSIFSLIIYSPQHDKIYVVETPIYTVTYSATKEQPIEVRYQVDTCDSGTVDRKGNFWIDKKYHTSDNKDYVDNVWDKGHMAPAGTFNCSREMMKTTFSYLNCALQHQSLNRGPWKELERFERKLSESNGTVHVKIRIHFKDTPENWLSTGALVPIGFTKTILSNGEELKFYFPNTDVSGDNWETFRIND